MLDVHKEWHPEDGEDEHHKEEQEADVKEGRHGHGQGKEQGSNPASSFDQSEDSSNLGDSNNSEKCWWNEILLDQVTQNDAWKFKINSSDKSNLWNKASSSQQLLVIPSYAMQGQLG